VVTWTADDTFTVDDVEYICRPVTGRFTSTANRFCLLKARWQVEWYEQLLAEISEPTSGRLRAGYATYA
jgi:hypothetical protein